MARRSVGWVLAVVMVGIAIPAAAEDGTANGHLASPAHVVPLWAKDDRAKSSSAAVKALSGSYGALQALDIYTTIVARRRGAVEANPLMNTGFTQAAAFKALMGATTLITVKAIEKNKKAAILTMVALNSVTAVVVANNVRNARRLR
jgi:hypothetical protein